MAVHERSFTENRAVGLLNKTALEVNQFLFWGKFMKFNTPDKVAVDPNRPPLVTNDAPIVVHRELTNKQGDTLEVPMLRSLQNLPKVGTAQVSGQEERQNINHAKVYVNLVRHGVLSQTSSIQRQITKDFDLARWVKPQLQDHYARMNAYMGISHAFYKGFSYNVVADTSWYTGSYAISAVSHPHIYLAGYGKVPYSSGNPGSAGYETLVNTRVNAVTSGNLFNVAFLEGLRVDDQIRKIPYLYTKDGMPYRIIVAHHYQIASLMADTNFRSVMNSALTGAKELAKQNPYLVGCHLFWNDWAIFDGGNCVWPVAYSASPTVPVWGPASPTALTSYEDYSASTKFAAIIIGDNAMAKAIASPFEVKMRADDYDEVQGYAYRIIEGYARPDYWNLDDGTAGAYVRNDSSAIAITYAAKPTM